MPAGSASILAAMIYNVKRNDIGGELISPGVATANIPRGDQYFNLSFFLVAI